MNNSRISLVCTQQLDKKLKKYKNVLKMKNIYLPVITFTLLIRVQLQIKSPFFVIIDAILKMSNFEL